jgi:four helix bundle protein
MFSVYINKETMEKKRINTIQELSLTFSIQLVSYKNNVLSKKSFTHTNQLIRAGTAIGAMIREAQEPESRKDFIHKMKIAAKEAEETEYWLIVTAIDYPGEEIEVLKDLILQIKRMLSKIIATSIANAEKPKNQDLQM